MTKLTHKDGLVVLERDGGARYEELHEGRWVPIATLYTVGNISGADAIDLNPSELRWLVEEAGPAMLAEMEGER